MRITRVRHDFRFAFMIMSGFLIVGATATWHAVGYLSFTGWFFEWADIVLAFICIYMATRQEDLKRNPVAYAIIAISSAVVLIPLERTSSLPVFTTPNPLFYLVFLIPILLLAYFIIFHNAASGHQKVLSLPYS